MRKLQLTDVEWGEFLFPEVFSEIFIAKSSDSNAISKGEIPFIGRSSVNNGFQGLFHVPEEKIVKKNCITVSMVGEPRAFYQPYDFTCSQNILILRNEVLNKNISKFLISNINNYLTSKGFGYGYPVGLNRVIKNKLMLPIDSQGQPNWQFMEDYIKQEQKIQAQKVIDYYEQKLIELACDVVGLEKVEWKSFRFTDIFQKIQRGKRLTKANQIKGKQPYVSSTAENNGVDAFIDNDKGVRKFENVLTLANSGSVGSTFYQYFEFVASDHVTALKTENADKYAYLFLASIVKRLEEKYSFNREINDTRITRERILLPTDEFGNPNWQYMSDFVKKMELDKVQEVLEYIYIYIYIKLKTMLNEKVCEMSWQDFWLEDVVEIQSGKDIYERERTVGNTPYITATANSNGIGYFVNNDNPTLESRCISVNRNGSVGYAFYHPYPALFGNDTRKLRLKYDDKYVGLFISNTITGQRTKYGYGYKMGTGRLKRQKIMLPVTADGQPDYDYMKSYMQKQELEQIYAILDYFYEEK